MSVDVVVVPRRQEATISDTARQVHPMGERFVGECVRFLAKRLSYSGALAYLVMAFGWICLGLGYLLVRSLADFSILDGSHASFVIAIGFCGLSSSVLCLLSHGAGSKLGQGAWSPDLRLLNWCFEGGEIRSERALKDPHRLSEALGNMPKLAAKRTIIWGAIVVLTTTMSEVLVSGTYANSKIILFAGSMSIAMLVGYSYLVTELYSAGGRARLKALCFEKGLVIQGPVALSLTVKFCLFAVFLLFSLITLAGVTLNGVRDWPVLVGCVLFSFVAGGMLMALTAMSILRSFREIVIAADDLAAGGAGQIFSSSLDLEMVELAGFLNQNAKEINATREHLEEMVDEKTEELRLAVKEAWEASLTKGRFLATMSHEIRTPMNAILGMTGLILDSDLDDEQREFAENIRSSGDTLLELINDVLDFSKLEVGKVVLDRLEFDVHDLVETVVQMLAERAQCKGLELVSFVSDDVGECMWGDPKRLLQILVNLVGNAIKFTHDGEVVIQVTAPEPGEVLVSIRDTGIGIAKEAYGEIFQAFSQADGTMTRSYGGTGLGLAIAKELVELMGGRISLESEIGVGTEFTISLPIEATECSSVRRWVEPNLEGCKFLLVEDNKSTSDALNYYLASWGASIIRTSSLMAAKESVALELDKGVPVDYALVDAHLGGADSMELYEALTSNHLGPKVVMMFNIAHRVRGNAEDLRRLRKPISRAVLARIASSLVAGEH